MKPCDADVLAVLHAHNAAPFSDAANHELLEQVPVELRLTHFTRRTIPPHHLASFGYYHDKIGNIHLDRVPDPMRRELIFVIWRIIEAGGRVSCTSMGLLARELAATCERLRTSGQPYRSLTDRGPAQWRTELATTWARRTGQLPNPNTLRTYVSAVDRACKLLWFAYDDGPWWRRELWDPQMDARIPRREHEPQARQTMHWYRIEPRWLRLGAMWNVKMLLESGQITWSTAHRRHAGFLVFSGFAVRETLASPVLCEDPTQLRPLMMRFLEETQTGPTVHGPTAGRRRSATTVATVTAAVRGLYTFMHDHPNDATRALGDPRWLQLGPEHLRFWRPGDLPKQRHVRFDERHLFSESVLARIEQHAPLLGVSRREGGVGDPQAMRLLQLLVATGRRINELCMLDIHPLVPVTTSADDGQRVAKLRYQQTKIEDGPETIFVGDDVVALIAEQQRWLTDHLNLDADSARPRYLFVQYQNNLHGTKPYSASVFRTQLAKLVARADLRDDDGQPLRLTRTHRMRHTKATNMINAGVPLHVVQRYMGHLSPEMTMHYAQTLDATAKTEFLRYQKIHSTGRHTDVAAEDLYELMALDTRTDRVLPNGWCTLPPTQSCEKGNACLTCDLFVTDNRYLPVHRDELTLLEDLIDRRQDAHREHTGSNMTENHVWLTLRRREQGALRTIITSLEGQMEPSASTPIRGAGAADRKTHDLQREDNGR